MGPFSRSPKIGPKHRSKRAQNRPPNPLDGPKNTLKQAVKVSKWAQFRPWTTKIGQNGAKIGHNTQKQVGKAHKRLKMGPNQAKKVRKGQKKAKTPQNRSEKPRKGPKWAQIRPKYLEIGRKSPEICLSYAFFTRFFCGTPPIN